MTVRGNVTVGAYTGYTALKGTIRKVIRMPYVYLGSFASAKQEVVRGIA